MFFRRAVQVLLISAILLHGQLQLSQAYTQVATSGSSGGHTEDGPKIYKALNFDLIFPKSFNSSENVISTTPTTVALETTSSPATVVDGLAGQQQYNPLPQSNEQTNRDDNGGDVSDSRPPLYITPSPNEPGLYLKHNSDSNTQDKENNAQVETQNPINIQQQQQQQQLGNDNSDKSVAAREQEQNIATGRAVDYHTGYPFGQLITPLIKNAPRPVYSGSKGKPSSTSSSVVYPQTAYQRKPPSQAEIDKLRGRGPIKDRFTPSEAVASHQIKANSHNHGHHHNHAPTYTAVGKSPAASNVVNTYVPPKNLYSFPPNNIDYPLPTQDNKLAVPSSIINSYSPPPSGSTDGGYKYAGPLNLGYLPSINNSGDGNGDDGTQDQQKDNGNDDSDTGNGDMDDSIGVLPASAMGGDNNGGMDTMDQMMPTKDDHSNDGHHDDHSYDTEKEYPTPPPEWLKSHPEALMDHPPHGSDDHSHDSDDHSHDDHEHHHHHDDHQPDIEFDHDHHVHQPDIIFDHDTPHSYPYHHSFPSFPIYPHYPEIIYDDHHHHHHDEPPPPTTTEAPLPEPPPEPRVKKYSYFYIGRKLWYIPLYFTVWFSFYVLWLILKSIARHKVNIPNHYVSRRSIDDSYNLSKNQQEMIDQLTVSVMDKIEKFKRKHLS